MSSGRLTSCRSSSRDGTTPRRAGKVFHLRVELTQQGKIVPIGNGPAE